MIPAVQTRLVRAAVRAEVAGQPLDAEALRLALKAAWQAMHTAPTQSAYDDARAQYHRLGGGGVQ